METIKLSVTDIDFYVNEAKKSVTCRVNYVVKSSDETLMLLLTSDCMIKNCCDFGSAVATARLNSADTFDVEIGKKVARAKAESLAYRQVQNYLNNVFTAINNRLLQPMLRFSNKAEAVVEHNDEYLAKF